MMAHHPSRLLSRAPLALAALMAAGLFTLCDAGPAQAASFPCSKAAKPDEIAICANPQLNDSDVEMAVRYEMLLQLLPMGGAGALRDAQRAWLASRQSCGGDVACLKTAYAARIAALKSGFQAIVSRGPY